MAKPGKPVIRYSTHHATFHYSEISKDNSDGAARTTINTGTTKGKGATKWGRMLQHPPYYNLVHSRSVCEE